jgi:hypothetical protein
VLCCVELFGGIARANNHLATDGERIPQFVSPCLLPLSGLMDYYADDLSICDNLLSLFCDYSSNCAELLDDGQREILFHASASLLKSYSTRHCTHRVMVIVEAENEEKSYHDILCAIQLLMNLSTQECNRSKSSSLDGAVDSAQVAEVLFFGLQQIIPLMTQGLLQYPTFCQKFFSLLGFAIQSYSCKVDTLPLELVDALIQSLLFGVNHQDISVAKLCLEGIGNLTKGHLRSGALTCHLSQRSDLLDGCTREIFQKVVFQPLVYDRLEATSHALLPLAAVQENRFSAVIHDLLVESSTIKNPEQHRCLGLALEKLFAQEIIANVLEEGYEGRINRRRFKESLEEFVKTVHSLVVFR